MSTSDSIRSLVEQTPSASLLSSPRKSKKILRCVILTKSELRETKNRDKMFIMTLSDEDPSSSIKAICFDASLYYSFEAMKTYCIENFKIKKAFGYQSDNCPMQIVIDQECKVEISLVQFEVNKKMFCIKQIIRKEAANVRCFNVNAKIISINEVETVGKSPNQKQKRDVILGDGTGCITLVLWREKALTFEFEKNDIISVENVGTSVFNNKINLSQTSETVIKIINDDELENVEVVGFHKAETASVITSVTSNIIGVKDFKVTSPCVNCRNQITLENNGSQQEPMDVIECSSCHTVFLVDDERIANECCLLLGYNNSWVTAKTGVSGNASMISDYEVVMFM